MFPFTSAAAPAGAIQQEFCSCSEASTTTALRIGPLKQQKFLCYGVVAYKMRLDYELAMNPVFSYAIPSLIRDSGLPFSYPVNKATARWAIWLLLLAC